MTKYDLAELCAYIIASIMVAFVLAVLGIGLVGLV
jgi:hypothetical protein